MINEHNWDGALEFTGPAEAAFKSALFDAAMVALIPQGAGVTEATCVFVHTVTSHIVYGAGIKAITFLGRDVAGSEYEANAQFSPSHYGSRVKLHWLVRTEV